MSKLENIDKVNLSKLNDIKKLDIGDDKKKIAIQSVVDNIQNLGDKIVDLDSIGTTAGKSISSVFKGMAASIAPLLPLIGAVAAGFALFEGFKFLDDKYTLTFGTAQKHLQESSSAYSSTVSELSSMNAELETSNARISELKNKGTLSFTEEVELEKLERQNSLLETQIKIKERLAESQGKEVTEDARESINFKSEEVLMKDENGVSMLDKSGNERKENIDRKEYVKRQIDALKKEKALLDKAENKYANAQTKKDKKLWEKQIQSSTKNIETYESSIQSKLGELNKEAESFRNSETGNIIKGFEKDFESIKKLNDTFNALYSTPFERQKNSIETAFENSNLSFVKDQLKEMASQSQLTEEDIKRMGIAIEGVDASEIAKYFNDMAKSANEAANATTKFGTLGEYKQALESANPGQDYLDIVEGLEKTKELYNQGLVGTDEFKSFSKMLSPSGATDGKNFIDNYNRLGKYFKSDDTSGINAFLTDLSKKTDSAGQSFASLDKKTGQWKINIKDTSEAAKQLGIGIVPFESMLKRLQDYDFDIDFHSAVEDFESVKTSLGGFDSVLERMQDGTRKGALKEQVDGWKSQLAGWEADLSTLDTDIAMKIKLEYSLAEIQAQIDEFKSKIDWGSANSENYANLLSGNDKYINTAKDKLGLNKENVKIPVEFDANEDKIEELKQQLAKTTSEEEKVKIQAEIANVQEVQKNLMDAFSDAHPEINADSSIEEISNALDSFFKSNEAHKILLGLDTREAKQQLDGILSNDGKVITMNVDASTEQIQKQLDSLKQGQTLVFNADVNGVQSTISAIRNEKGTLSYYAEVDGVVKELKRVENKDGTITYKPNTTAVDAETAKTDGGTRYVLYQANTTGLPTYFNPITRTVEYKYKGGESSIERFNRTGSALPIGQSFNGTAHANGTLLNTRNGSAFSSGDWGAKKTEKALVGELGQELLIRGSHFETIGDNGAEFANIRKGDVIFNHIQTRELLKNGYVTSGGGRAKVVGGAFASGTAYAGSTTGSGKLPSGSSSSKKKKKKSSSKSSSSKSSDKATKDAADKAKEAAESVIDFVEIAIKRIDEGIKRIKITAESTFKTFSKRNNALGQEMSAIVNKINVSQQAYNKYMSQANKVGLSENYAKQVRDGSINIETIKDENLSKKINDYQEW